VRVIRAIASGALLALVLAAPSAAVAAPAVLTAVPLAGDVDVAPASSVRVTFTDALLAATVTGASVQLLDASGVVDVETGLRLEERLQASLFGKPDQMEAVRANIEKREARFTDPE